MTSADREQREQLLQRAVLAGDEEAWRTWYLESFDELDRYALWRCGNHRDRADDVVQETWLMAVRRMRRFDPSRASFVAWLRGLAANILRNQLRHEHRRIKREQAARANRANEYEATHPDQPNEAARSMQIAMALAALPERQEAVLRAKYLDGQSVAEIAAAARETPKAIESLLTRARESFRATFNNVDNPSSLDPHRRNA